MIAELVWREPAWFALALVPWLFLLGRYLWSATDSRAYADPVLLPWARVEQHGLQRWRRHWRELFSVLAWLLLAAALAGPRLPQSLHSEETERLPELMVVLDVSHSMSADDIYPTRLARARLELQDLIDRLEGWRAGLVVYAGQPHLLVPPTDDKALFRHYLSLPRTGWLPVEGSDLRSALQFAATTAVKYDVPRHLLLISDGETLNSDSDTEQALQNTVTELQQSGHRLYILGVGSEAGASLTDPQGGWLSQEGQSVTSRLQRERLDDLAARGDGRYVTAADNSGDWQQLYDHGLATTLSGSLSEQTDGLVIWRELFGWCLLPGVLLLLLAHVRLPRQRAMTTSLPLLSGIVLVGHLLTVPQPGYAAETDRQQAWHAFEQADYAKAQEAYRRVPGYLGRLGEGSSAYQREEYHTALQQFTRAVASAHNDAQRADALFNLGNSYARLERYVEAASIYADVLRYQPDHARAKQNLTLAEQRAREQAQQPGGERGRQGRGSRSRELGEDESLTRGSLTLGDQSGSEGIALGGETDTGETASRDSGAVSLSDESVMVLGDPQWDYAVSDLRQLDQRAAGMQSEPARLWQRLFETEAGYPAALDQPEHQPGVRPW